MVETRTKVAWAPMIDARIIARPARICQWRDALVARRERCVQHGVWLIRRLALSRLSPTGRVLACAVLIIVAAEGAARQCTATTYRVGLIAAGSPNRGHRRVRGALEEAGYVEGRNPTIEDLSD